VLSVGTCIIDDFSSIAHSRLFTIPPPVDAIYFFCPASRNFSAVGSDYPLGVGPRDNEGVCGVLRLPQCYPFLVAGPSLVTQRSQALSFRQLLAALGKTGGIIPHRRHSPFFAWVDCHSGSFRRQSLRRSLEGQSFFHF